MPPLLDPPLLEPTPLEPTPLEPPPPLLEPAPETRLQPGWLVQLLAESRPQGVMEPEQLLLGPVETQLHPWRIWHAGAEVSEEQAIGVPVHDVDELHPHPETVHVDCVYALHGVTVPVQLPPVVDQ
jgi:hypothetical protein